MNVIGDVGWLEVYEVVGVSLNPIFENTLLTKRIANLIVVVVEKPPQVSPLITENLRVNVNGRLLVGDLIFPTM